jgi:TatD DNase family protein
LASLNGVRRQIEFILWTLFRTILQLYDIHIHLTDEVFSPYLNQLLAGMRAMKMIACSVTVDVSTTRKTLESFGEYHDVVRNFIGIHPEAAGREDLEIFRGIFAEHVGQIDGVGEIGLDRTYDERGIASYEMQKQVFGAMLQLAESGNKPVSIHSRKALDDVLEILPSYKLKNVLLHWFAGSKKQLARAADMNLYISFGPALVYSDDKKVLLRNAPRDRILVETDGPVTFGRCFENLPASPTSFLVSVVSSIARTLGIGFEQACSVLESNSLRYLSS